MRRRLRDAALELYGEHGFDRTTAAEVAARAGVTERTYFRHFADKREVVFDGEAALRAAMTDAVARAPDLPPLGVLRAAFLSVATGAEEDRERQVHQNRVISSAPDLQERAATKAASITGSVAEALERRGVPQGLASLAAACGGEVLERARQQWLAGSPDSLAVLVAAGFADLDLLLRDATRTTNPPTAQGASG